MQKLTSLLFLIFAMSCGNVPVTSLPKINAIDFKTTDLEQLEAVAKVPLAIDTTKLEVVYVLKISTEGKSKEFTSLLERWDGNAETRDFFEKHEEAGYQILSYRMSASDIVKADDMRNLASQWKEEYGWAKGEAGVFLRKYCYRQSQDLNDLRGNLWIRTEETDGYVLMFKDLDLRPENSEQIDLMCE